MKMDAHSEYDKDYIDKCFKSLIKNDVDNVGGNVIHVPRENTPIGRSICTVLSSPFGVGNSFLESGQIRKDLLILYHLDVLKKACY